MNRVVQLFQDKTNRKAAIFGAHVVVSTALQGLISLTMGGLPGATLLAARTIIPMVVKPALFLSAAKWFLPDWLAEDTKGMTKMLSVGALAAWSARAVAAPIPGLGELLAPFGLALGVYFAPNLWEEADYFDWPSIARDYFGTAIAMWERKSQPQAPLHTNKST